MNIDDGARMHRRQGQGYKGMDRQIRFERNFPVRAECEQEFGRDTDSTFHSVNIK